MDKKPDYKKVKKFVQDFAHRLKDEIEIEKVVLFGSYAKGIASAESDVDIVIISPDFAKMDTWQRFKVLDKAYQDYTYEVEYFGFTPREFGKASPLTALGEIKRTGMVIPI